MTELESAQTQMEQEQAIQKVLLAKLARTTIVQAPQQEMVAYRLAEIFVAARQLYTGVLPAFLESADPAPVQGDEDDPVFELFGEVRLNLLHLRDLIEDFEETFLESLSGRLDSQRGDGDEEPDDDAT